MLHQILYGSQHLAYYELTIPKQANLSAFVPNSPTVTLPPTNQNPQWNHHAQLAGLPRSTSAIMLASETKEPLQDPRNQTGDSAACQPFTMSNANWAVASVAARSLVLLAKRIARDLTPNFDVVFYIQVCIDGVIDNGPKDIGTEEARRRKSSRAFSSLLHILFASLSLLGLSDTPHHSG